MHLNKMTSFHFSIRIALALILALFCALPTEIVYALPAPATGWVEVQCSPVPEDFSDTATVVLSNTETGEYYTITCYKVNDYVGRLQLPAGKYQVEQTSTADNFTYEASTETSSFEITADMSAAQLITLTITKHDVSYELPPEPSDESTDNPKPDVLTDPSSQVSSDSKTPNSSPDASNPVLDWIAEESAPDHMDTAESDETIPSEEGLWDFSGKRVLYVLIGTILFIIFVMTVSYFVRLHYEKE